MTKSIIITYNEADESLLMSLFKRFKIKTKPAVKPASAPPNDDDRIRTKEEFMADLRESIEEVKAHLRGEIELPTMEDLWAELEEDAVKA